MIGKDYAATFGSFGGKLSAAIVAQVTELGDILAAGEDELAFRAKCDEINQISYDVFREYIDDFITAMAGYLAFHGTNEITGRDERPTHAVVAMAHNANTIMTEVVTSALWEAEAYLTRPPDGLEQIGQLIDELMEQLGNPAEWHVTEGEHPLADLFSPPDGKMNA